MDMANLKWLDLSNNRMKVIRDHTFDGLQLEHLFLNGNRNLALHIYSFGGLAVTGLYLHDCSLAVIQPDLFQPLNTTLKVGLSWAEFGFSSGGGKLNKG